MTTIVTRFTEIDPTHGRPRLLTFVDPTRRELHVHVQREDQSLWLFAVGPAGGDRGTICLMPRRAAEVTGWLSSSYATLLSGGMTYLSLSDADSRGERTIKIRKVGQRSEFIFRIDCEATEVFHECLADWARIAQEASA